MLDLRTAASNFDDSVLISHVRDLPTAALITLIDPDDNEPLTYALVRFGHDVHDANTGSLLPAG